MSTFPMNGEKFPFYILNPDKSLRGTNDIREWGEMCQRDERRIISQDRVNGMRVSTVFLGIPHLFGGGRLNIFETMIFKDGDWGGEYQERYDTYDQAVSGHARAMAWAASTPRQAET